MLPTALPTRSGSPSVIYWLRDESERVVATLEDYAAGVNWLRISWPRVSMRLLAEGRDEVRQADLKGA
jgi:hypothetical protein